MSKLHVVKDDAPVVHYWFRCPGCLESHHFSTPRWQFDGNLEAPTFRPSLRYPGHRKVGNPTLLGECHLYLTAGRIEFLQDCSHALAGQTVDLPVWCED